MIKIFLVILSALFFITGHAQQPDEFTVTRTGDTLPNFRFEIEKGKTVNMADYKGKVILINLFATWCPPCRKELPEMQSKIWNKYKNNTNFELFVFGREEGWEVLEPFKKKTKFTFPILPDADRSIFSLFATQSIPRNILVDQNGKIIYQSVGYEEKEFEELLQLIEKTLQQH